LLFESDPVEVFVRVRDGKGEGRMSSAGRSVHERGGPILRMVLVEVGGWMEERVGVLRGSTGVRVRGWASSSSHRARGRRRRRLASRRRGGGVHSQK